MLGALKILAPIPFTLGNSLEPMGRPQFLVCNKLGPWGKFCNCNGKIALERDIAACPILIRARALQVKLYDIDREAVLGDDSLARKECNYILNGDGIRATLRPSCL